MAGTLYVVATPIGNLQDISLRALRILGEVDLIAAEDTRVTRKLLSHFDLHTPLTSFHQHTRGEKAESLVERLAAGQSIALVSDAGMPGISDPGGELIKLAIEQGAAVVPVPGANAAISALVVSGLPTGQFSFVGFPPRTKTDRRTFFESLRHEPRPVILYEAPTRLLATLDDLHRALGDRPCAIARELTKLHEEVYRGTLTGALAHFYEQKPRGEFTLVVGPGAPTPAEPPVDVAQALRSALESGATPRDAVATVASRFSLPRRVVYRRMLELKS